jgi:hypothetical protein
MLRASHKNVPPRLGRIATGPINPAGSKHWIKIKNRKHEAFDRLQEAHRRAG